MSADSTRRLLARARAGDADALDSLFARHLPRLQRWASGRLPRWARDAADTPDLVQDTLLQTLRRLDGFEPQHEGALQAYLRQAVMNRIRDEIRRRQRRPASVEVDPNTPATELSPLEQALGRETVDRYEAAMAGLHDEERALLIGRIELGLSYEELARVTDKPSADAARKATKRALVRLVSAMSHGG